MAYGSEDYIRTLADFGAPRYLAGCGGWVLERPVPGGLGLRDAMGPYPLFACRDWNALEIDLDDLRAAGLVSLVLVTDPLSGPPADRLPAWFDGVCHPWKDHNLVDLTGGAEFGTAHHRRNARRFARHAYVEILGAPTAWLDTWCDLYDQLGERHGISGLARFSRLAFAGQLGLKGALVLRAATSTGVTAGLQIWLMDGDRAWHHLSAYSRDGYRWGGASYAMVAAALQELRSRGLKVADLGAGAGLAGDSIDGLSRFKQGWATHTAPAWLCGAVLDRERYADLSLDLDTGYFPAYRDPARALEVVHAGGD